MSAQESRREGRLRAWRERWAERRRLKRGKVVPDPRPPDPDPNGPSARQRDPDVGRFHNLTEDELIAELDLISNRGALRAVRRNEVEYWGNRQPVLSAIDARLAYLETKVRPVEEDGPGAG